MLRTRLLAKAALLLAALLVLGLAPGSSAASRPRFTPFRVGGEPMRAITLTEVRQFSALSVPDLPRLKDDGFNTVTLYAYRFVSDPTDSSIQAGAFTEPDASLGATIDAAHDLGLAVQLIPVVWVGTGLGDYSWRGRLAPSDVNAFFDSYRYMVDHYADLAQQHSVEMFGIGSELCSLERQDYQWRRTAAEARQHYRGPLTYFTIPSTVQGVRWWSAVDYPGVSPYLSLSSAASPGYDEVASAWRRVHLPTLRKLSAFVGRPLLVSEIGYAAVAGAATHPETSKVGVPDERLQADLYRAVVDVVMRDPSVDGVSFFRWSAYQAGAVDSGFSPKGKNAECVLAQAWGGAATTLATCAVAGRVLA